MEKSEIIYVSRDRSEKGHYVAPILKGLKYTLGNFFRKPITIQYPDEKTKRSARGRGLHRLNVDERGDLKCVACGLCAAICPSQAIALVPYEEEGKRGIRKNSLSMSFDAFFADSARRHARRGPSV